MDNKIQVFQNNELGELRVIEINSEPWFVAKDICEILGLSNPTMAINRLDEDERTKLNLGRQGEANIVNEYGLYNLILASRKKEAKEFKRWITHEVLPAIRKTGGYIAGEEKMSDDELIAKAMGVLHRKLEQANKQLEQQKPKVIFADSVETSKDSILIRDLAKLLNQNGIDMGQNRLYDYMRENGYLINSRFEDRNMPTQKAMNMGLFEIKEGTINTSHGTRLARVTKVTGKGQIYFMNKFKQQMSKVEDIQCPF